MYIIRLMAVYHHGNAVFCFLRLDLSTYKIAEMLICVACGNGLPWRKI